MGPEIFTFSACRMRALLDIKCGTKHFTAKPPSLRRRGLVTIFAGLLDPVSWRKDRVVFEFACKVVPKMK